MSTEPAWDFVCPLGVQAWCFLSSLKVADWAAWAQAIGGIAAVFAAIFVVRWQLRNERRRADYLEAQRMFMLWVLVYHARASLTYLQESCRANPANFHVPNDLRTNLAILETVPLFDMPDDYAAVAVATAIGAYKDFNAGLEHKPQTYSSVTLPQRQQSHLNALELNLDFSESLLRREVERRGWKKKITGKDYRMNDVDYPPRPPAA